MEFQRSLNFIAEGIIIMFILKPNSIL